MAKEYPPGFEGAIIHKNGSVEGPKCCGEKMLDDGDCGQGCCDDYRCGKCGFTCRVEWPD